jgi:AcrR family transcriptional regulator
MSASVSRSSAAELQRARIIDATVAVVGGRGFAGATVASVIARAGVSRRTFYEHFEGLEDCFIAVLDLGAETLTGIVAEAFAERETWLDGLRSAIASLLVFFDSEPLLARVWLVESMAAGTRVLEHRERRVQDLFLTISEAWPLPKSVSPRPLTIEGVFASVRALIVQRLIGDGASADRPLVGLLGPLMGLIAAPFLDDPAVDAEVERGERFARKLIAGRRGESEPPADPALPPALSDPRAHRARRCVLYVADHPGVSNREIADGIGIARHDQISTLLSRLAGLGLLAKQPGAPGRPNSWTLTPPGAEAARALIVGDVESRRPGARTSGSLSQLGWRARRIYELQLETHRDLSETS